MSTWLLLVDCEALLPWMVRKFVETPPFKLRMPWIVSGYRLGLFFLIPEPLGIMIAFEAAELPTFGFNIRTAAE